MKQRTIITAASLATITATVATGWYLTDPEQAPPALTVAGEHEAGYHRDQFRHWIDANNNGCDTRQEVLKTEATTLTRGDCAAALTGEWTSIYDATTVTDPAALDVDHLVPLAEAWASGAWSWDDTRRKEYANYLADPDHLVAVTASSNRSKGDRDPAQWLPPDEGAWCWYIAAWQNVKAQWGLSVDVNERDAIAKVAATC